MHSDGSWNLNGGAELFDKGREADQSLGRKKEKYIFVVLGAVIFVGY